MGEIFQNTTLNSSDKAIIIIAAITVIVLVLLIMYKLDNLPDNYKLKKKMKVTMKKIIMMKIWMMMN